MSVSVAGWCAGRDGKDSRSLAFSAVARQGNPGRHVLAAGVQRQGALAGRRRQRSAVDPLQRRRRSNGHLHGARHAAGRRPAVR